MQAVDTAQFVARGISIAGVPPNHVSVRSYHPRFVQKTYTSMRGRSMQNSNKGRGRTYLDTARESDRLNTTSDTSNLIGDHAPMKLIPWEDIWTSLRVARIRGNGEMIEVFYNTLFKEAVFDDNGAWELDVKNGH
jgi:hypothetical protein